MSMIEYMVVRNKSQADEISEAKLSKSGMIIPESEPSPTGTKSG